MNWPDDQNLEQPSPLKYVETVTTATPASRYKHKCKRCKDEFENILQHCDYCCVCEIRNQRDEWE